jgi:cytidine deaminase
MARAITTEQEALLAEALRARDAAYAPYSHFKVGAAVRAASGKVYAGCNVENASYGLSICAERVAIFTAIAAGETEIAELALAAGAEPPARPCGACRQVLFEFGKDADVVMGNTTGTSEVLNLKELFPEPFVLDKK